MSIFPGLSPKWYSDFITAPTWQKILGCGKFETYTSLKSCRGFLPLQMTTGLRCNGHGYKCADRSDKSDCSGKKKKTLDVRLNRHAKFWWKCFLKLICFQGVLSVPLDEPGKRQIIQCARTTDHKTNFKQDRVMINGTCFHVESICRNDGPSETCPIGSICTEDYLKLVSCGKLLHI